MASHYPAGSTTVEDQLRIYFDGTNFYAVGKKDGADSVSKKLGSGIPTVVFHQYYEALGSIPSGNYLARSYKNETDRTMIMLVSGAGNGDGVQFHSGTEIPSDFYTQVMQGTWSNVVRANGRIYWLEVPAGHTAYVMQWGYRSTASLTVIDCAT